MKVGDYVRTKNGIIGKLQIEKENIAVANWNGDYELEEITNYIINNNRININEIVKSSPNIIDLIEVGDYVNGHTVKMIKEDKSKIDIGEGEDYFWLRNQDIKSIVTKEKFKQKEYKIRGNDD